MENSNVILAKLSNGDIVRRYYKGIIVDFAGNRRVLSTSLLNGGVRDDLGCVFNYNCLADEEICQLHEDTYEKELAANARNLNLKPEKTTGLSTAAWMELASVKTIEFEDLNVTAIVTGGIDTNATRVCDRASYYEKMGEYHRIKPGTINIILHINCALPAGTIARTLVTCSEAKAVAVEELMIGSKYSHGLATGSGTDGTIVICDMDSQNMLTDAGEHAKLGEMIGDAVKAALKDALHKQTGACPSRQHKLLVRCQRYGITIGVLWDFYINNKELFNSYEKCKDMNIRKFEHILMSYNGNSTVVTWISMYLYILDQMEWKMLEWAEGIRETKYLASYLWEHMGLKNLTCDYCINREKDTVLELVEQLKYIIIVFIINSDIFGE